ncbi:MAG: hypothetical protein ACTSRG_26415 [Candidatus Helarchaeota archaeon]
MANFFTILKSIGKKFVGARKAREWAKVLYKERNVDGLINGLKKEKGNNFIKRYMALTYLREIQPIDEGLLSIIKDILLNKSNIYLRYLAAITIGEIGSKIADEKSYNNEISMENNDNQLASTKNEEDSHVSQLNSILLTITEGIKKEKKIFVINRLIESISKIGPEVNNLDNEKLFKKLNCFFKKTKNELIKLRIIEVLGKIKTTNKQFIEKLFSICIEDKEKEIIKVNAIWAIGEVGRDNLKNFSKEINLLIEVIKTTKDTYYKNTLAHILSKLISPDDKNYQNTVDIFRTELENSTDTFYFALALARLEGVESEGHMEILKLYRMRHVNRQKRMLFKELELYWKREKIIHEKPNFTYLVSGNEFMESADFRKNKIPEKPSKWYNDPKEFLNSRLFIGILGVVMSIITLIVGIYYVR